LQSLALVVIPGPSPSGSFPERENTFFSDAVKMHQIDSPSFSTFYILFFPDIVNARAEINKFFDILL
jgi:hypothetical protein